jgi:hypothetical protein
MRHWRLLLIPPAGLLLFCGLQLSCVKRGGGHGELDLELVLSNALTTEPIPDATIFVYAGSEWDFLNGQQRFYLHTDEHGAARRTMEQRLYCEERECLLWTTMKWRMTVPQWVIFIQEPGYEDIEALQLAKIAGEVERVGPGKGRVVVRIALKPKP